MSADDQAQTSQLRAAGRGARLASALALALRHVRPKLLLASSALLVLVVGFASRPRGPDAAGVAAREGAAPSLEARVQQREPARMFRGVQDVGRRALAHVVTFPSLLRAPDRIPFADFTGPHHETHPPLGFGLLVSADRDVLTHVGALGGTPDPVVQLPDGSLMRGRATVHEPETGLVLVRLAGTFTPRLPSFAEAPAQPGELAVATARVDGGDFVAPVFVASVQAAGYTLSAASNVIDPGTPIFNVAGAALAIAAGHPARGTALAAGAGLARLRGLAAAGHGLPAYVGVALQELTPELRQRLGEGAVVVSDLMEEGPAERAGLRAGDVLVRVGAVEPRGTLEALKLVSELPPGAATALAVRRRGATLEFTVTAEPALVLGGNPALSRSTPPEAPTAGSGFDPAALEAAGVSSQALVLACDGQPVSAAQPLASLQRRRRAPWLVYLQDGERRFFALIGRGA